MKSPEKQKVRKAKAQSSDLSQIVSTYMHPQRSTRATLRDFCDAHAQSLQPPP